jgi:hypothetical protein
MDVPVPAFAPALEDLSRGERAAGDLLDTLLASRPAPGTRTCLEHLLEDHRRAEQALAGLCPERARRNGAGGELWATVRGGVDTHRTIEDLHRAEGEWVAAYERALRHGEIEAEGRFVILSTLLPRQRTHAPLLERALAFS